MTTPPLNIILHHLKLQNSPDQVLLETAIKGTNTDTPNKQQIKEYQLFLKKHQIKLLNITETAYPAPLRAISNPPPLIYYKGNIKLLSEKNIIAFVGSRRFTDYGKMSLQKILKPIIQDIITISGMAIGIDTIAHNYSIQNNRPTIAVLASGLTEAAIYPKQNMSLAKQIIAAGGLLISEHPPLTQARQWHFTHRNRIITALAKATCVIEASLASGSISSANHANAQGKDVFAMPGNINSSTSSGTNHLISQGASPIINEETLAKYLNINQKTKVQTNKQYEIILKRISTSPATAESIAEDTNLDTNILQQLLTEMLIDNLITENNGIYYIL